MKMLKLFFISLMLISFISCDSNEPKKVKSDFKLIKLKGKYSLLLPKYMTKATGLNDDVSIQYQHLRKEVYATVMEESKEDILALISEMDSLELLSFYESAYLSPYEEELESYQVNNQSTRIIHGLPARIVEFEALLEGKHPVSYLLCFVEGERQIYTIALWTLKKNRAKNSDTFKRIIRSFKELE